MNDIETKLIDVVDQYREKVEKLIEEHVPWKEVQANVETKIVLQDDEPICIRLRRLAIKEKTAWNKQVDE